MIVIPMAGRSQRFKDAGFELPKYRLLARGQSLFYHSLISFRRYFADERFLFIVLEEDSSKDFILMECNKLGIQNIQIVELCEMTSGQAQTVSRGLQEINIDLDEHVLIFNIDTFRWGFQYPGFVKGETCSGYLEVFIGEGANWSNVIPSKSNSNLVLRTSEKKNESNLCSTGMYYFSSVSIFQEAFGLAVKNDWASDGELFIAPIYNELITLGYDIRYEVIDRNDVIFCGVPSEYYDFLSRDSDSADGERCIF